LRARVRWGHWLGPAAPLCAIIGGAIAGHRAALVDQPGKRPIGRAKPAVVRIRLSGLATARAGPRIALLVQTQGD
jgi:hypothetical protein